MLMSKLKKILRQTSLAGLCLFSLSACAAMDTQQTTIEDDPEGLISSEKETLQNYRFSDIPVPSKFKLDQGNSFVYEAGSGTVKVGHLFYSGWGSVNDIVAFYKNEMVNKGWTLLGIMESDGFTLNFDKEEWIATVIVKSSLTKSKIEILVGPK